MTRNFNNGIVNSRTIVAPIAAFTMAGLLYVYSRTSIKAAKRNAERHRVADGGQISWQNESLRRHGVLKRPDDDDSPMGLIGNAKGQASNTTSKSQESPKRDVIRQARRRKPSDSQ